VAVALVVVSAVAGFATGIASAKLSAPEQTWVDPVIKVYDLEAKALSVVQAQELVVIEDSGAGKYVQKLEGTLAVFASCPVAMNDAGAPPSVRLQSFDHDMVVSCQHLYSGGEDVAHAIADVRVGQGKPAATALGASTPQLVAGAQELTAAEHLLASIGGKSAFEA
jgi:hypothetical protein